MNDSPLAVDEEAVVVGVEDGCSGFKWLLGPLRNRLRLDQTRRLGAAPPGSGLLAGASGRNGARPESRRPTEADKRAAIVVVSAGERRNEEIYRLLAQNKIDVALRACNLRLSPHLYNTFDDNDRAVGVLVGPLALNR